MKGQTIFLLWYEESFESPTLCGIYDTLAAAEQHRDKLLARRDKYFRYRSRHDYAIDEARVGAECRRGVEHWPRKRIQIKPQGVSR